MKVLMISSRADMGGGPKYLWDLVRTIKGIAVFVSSPDEKPFAEHYKEKAVKFYSIPHRSFSLFSFIFLFWNVKKEKIDVIHSHGRGAGIYSRLLKLTGAKVIHTYHGVHFSHLSLWIEKILLPFADVYLYCSEDEKKEAERLGIIPKKCKVIVNAVDLRNFTFKHEIENVRVIGTIARFDPVKGYNYFIKNIKYLNYNKQHFEFKVAGSKREDFQILELPENIEFLGEIQNTSEFFDSIDLLVSHSLKEGMPLTVLEAMASGVPCLLSNVPGHQYFISNGLAVGFELDNSSDLETKLKLLQNSEFRRTLVNRASTFVNENHDLSKMVDKIIKVYENL